MPANAASDSPPARNAPSISFKKLTAALGLSFVLTAIAIWGMPEDGAWVLGVGVVALTLVLVSPTNPQPSAPQNSDGADSASSDQRH